jgi:hypothetical protein
MTLLSVYVSSPLIFYTYEAYKITLLCVCVSVYPPFIFLVFMRFVPYQMKVGDQFFPELLVVYFSSQGGDVKEYPSNVTNHAF